MPSFASSFSCRAITAILELRHDVIRDGVALTPSETISGDEACRRSLHSFSDRVCISEVVFATLAEGLGISWRYLSHIMTERKQLASNIVRRHAGLDTNQARRNIRKPGPNPAAAKLLTQNNRPPVIQPDQMQRVRCLYQCQLCG